MKRLVLVRHATAVAGAPGAEDFSRELRKKGRREARAMAAWFRGLGIGVDEIVSSPAERALETARIFAKALGVKGRRFRTDERLYAALDPAGFLGVVREFDDGHESVMVFGHDPTFTNAARSLVADFDLEIPKGGVVSALMRRKRWSSIHSGDARLEVFQHPEGLAEVRDAIAAGIADGILRVLEDFGVRPDSDRLEGIHKASARVAKENHHRAVLPAKRVIALEGEGTE